MNHTKKKILIISNGEAEDKIACDIIQHMQSDDVEFIAAPLVSHGQAYLSRHIPICCPTASLPSCGFSNQSFKALKNDFHSGLGSLLMRQYKAIRAVRHDIAGVITSGDVFPQIMATFTGKPFVSVFTALSEYYVRDHDKHFSKLVNTLEQKKYWKSSVFSIFDRTIMKFKHCKGVFVRDALTNDILKKFNINSYFLGNPMMDNLHETMHFSEFDQSKKTILLLPGSRTPETYYNLNRMIDVINYFDVSYNIAVSLANNIDMKKALEIIDRCPYKIHLLKNQFSPLLNTADSVIAMCGTAAEQAVGKGLPVFSFPGKGPQFSYAFAEAQQRLLGDNYFLKTDDDEKIAAAIECQMQQPPNPDFILNGKRRMGEPGGAKRIAQQITQLLLSAHPVNTTHSQETT